MTDLGVDRVGEIQGRRPVGLLDWSAIGRFSRYSSTTTFYDIAKEWITLALEENKKVVVLHLGDHDPSGLDMTRDLRARLSTVRTVRAVRAGRKPYFDKGYGVPPRGHKRGR